MLSQAPPAKSGAGVGGALSAQLVCCMPSQARPAMSGAGVGALGLGELRSSAGPSGCLRPSPSSSAARQLSSGLHGQCRACCGTSQAHHLQGHTQT